MKNYVFLVWFPIPCPRFTSILPCLIRLYTFCYNVVNMYWTRLLPFTLSFVKRHLALDDSRMDVQTRWCYMDVETRNICFCDYDQKMWFTCYTECIPFGFYVVPRQQPSICEWLWGVKICVTGLTHTLFFHRGADSKWHNDPLLPVTLVVYSWNNALFTHKKCPPTLLREASLSSLLLFTLLYQSLPCKFSSEAMNHWLFNLNDKINKLLVNELCVVLIARLSHFSLRCVFPLGKNVHVFWVLFWCVPTRRLRQNGGKYWPEI